MQPQHRNGWISLHRSLFDWEWYQTPNVSRLFIHLLLRANHEDGSWQGHAVKRGQTICGRKALSEELRISERTIRTCLSKLKSTNEITIESTTQFSIITICNYNKYQDAQSTNNKQDSQQIDQRSTNDRPTIDQRLTTNNKDNKDNKNNKNIDTSYPASLVDPEGFIDPFLKTDLQPGVPRFLAPKKTADAILPTNHPSPKAPGRLTRKPLELLPFPEEGSHVFLTTSEVSFLLDMFRYESPTPRDFLESFVAEFNLQASRGYFKNIVDHFLELKSRYKKLQKERENGNSTGNGVRYYRRNAVSSSS